jgi:hypothetical protein
MLEWLRLKQRDQPIDIMKCFTIPPLKALLLSACLLPVSGALAGTVQVTAHVSGTTTWYQTNEYVLNGPIYVLNGGVLNIEAGTVVKGKPGGTNDASALYVTQGGKIFAEGTRTKPIIFTAEQDDVTDPGDLGIYNRGLWGGVVLFGKARINMAADGNGNLANPKYEIYEGLDTNTVVNGQTVYKFGGDDDDDSSGELHYVSIRHGGVKILPNKEINGLSMGGVGRGTVIDHVECYAIADDGFEFFGGTVNTRYCVAAFCDDDGFDTDMGYRGKNQFWMVIQERGAKDNGAELNGEINGATTGTNQPIGNFEIYNCTWIGAGTNTAANRGLQIRDFAAPRIYNSIIMEFGGAGVRIDEKAGLYLTNGLLDLRNNLWWNFAANGTAAPVAETPQAELLFSQAARSNDVINPMIRSINRSNTPAFQLDPRPAPGSPALTSSRKAPQNGFYKPVAYAGAFNGLNWASGWTALSEYGIQTGAGGGVEVPDPVTTDCTPALLSITESSGSAEIAFSSVAGKSYQLLGSSSVTAALNTWSQVATMSASGPTSSFSVPTSSALRFFVVRCQ